MLPRDVLHLLPANNPMRPGTVLSVHPSNQVLACDFYVEGAEKGEEVPGGYRLGRLLNIDHHAPTPRMSRMISSTNLAIEQIRAGGVEHGALVVLNHTDCDSVLSGAIMAGLLPPDPAYGIAAIAADHTGEVNAIADLLQALEPLRDPCVSLESLATLEHGGPLTPTVARRLEEREGDRRRAERYVAEGRFQIIGKLAWAELDSAIDACFFPALLPDVWLILLVMPLADRPNRREVKVRLGLAASPGLTLHDLDIGGIDPAFGGRWNAGSNRRAGGTSLPAATYARALSNRLAAQPV
jgi:hypothetical protein